MQIQIVQKEIETAIINFLTSAGINTADKQIDISFTAGRKGTGVTAEVNINDVVFTPAVKSEKPEEVVEVVTADVAVSTDTTQPGFSTTAPTTLNGGLFGN